MKLLIIGLFSVLFFADNHSSSKEDLNATISCGLEATCYGNNPCNACKNCNYCKHCNSGGTCGICAPTKKKAKPSTVPPTPAQCKAITKKGTRCKRSASSNGYCWQHS